MSTSKVLMAGAIAAFFALPLVASAQSAPSSPPPGVTSGTVTGSNAHQQGGGGLMGALRGMDLTPQQRTQIQAIVTQYRQAHPKGSTPDPQGRKAMRQQVMAILTPDQQATLKERMLSQHQAHGGNGSGAQAPQNDAFPSDGGSPPP